MIVRILHEGQYDVDPTTVERLERLDTALEAALGGNDEATFSAALTALLQEVRSKGRPLAPDEVLPSDLTLPDEGASREDVASLLASEPIQEN